MIPPVLIPILIRIGTHLVDLAFKHLTKLPEEKKTQVLDKVEEDDKKRAEKKAAKEIDDVQW